MVVCEFSQSPKDASDLQRPKESRGKVLCAEKGTEMHELCWGIATKPMQPKDRVWQETVPAASTVCYCVSSCLSPLDPDRADRSTASWGVLEGIWAEEEERAEPTVTRTWEAIQQAGTGCSDNSK